jgi:hypothetical protein
VAAVEDTDDLPAMKSIIILATRLNHSEIFINEAQNAREALI